VMRNIELRLDICDRGVVTTHHAFKSGGSPNACTSCMFPPNALEKAMKL
jgi:hypothetical protein